jgi:hypothetical protein
MSRIQRCWSPTAVNLSFLDRSSYFSFKYLLIYPHKGWVDPVPDPLLRRKSCSAGNRIRDLESKGFQTSAAGNINTLRLLIILRFIQCNWSVAHLTAQLSILLLMYWWLAVSLLVMYMKGPDSCRQSPAVRFFRKCRHDGRWRLPLWSSGQSSWLLTQRSRVLFPALPDFLSSSGSEKGSTQPLWG